MKKFLSIGKIFISVFCLTMVLFFSYQPLSKAFSLKNAIAEEGVLSAYGNGFVGEGHNSYRICPFIVHIGLKAHDILPSLIPYNNGKLLFYLEPQYVIVTHPSGNYELGIGLGLEYRFNITNSVDGYLLAGSGLHYISFDSKYQSGGFNFNDNLGFGIYIFTSKNRAVNIGFRFRHISNADLNMPNEGINSYLFVAGYSLFFK